MIDLWNNHPLKLNIPVDFIEELVLYSFYFKNNGQALFLRDFKSIVKKIQNYVGNV